MGSSTNSSRNDKNTLPCDSVTLVFFPARTAHTEVLYNFENVQENFERGKVNAL